MPSRSGNYGGRSIHLLEKLVSITIKKNNYFSHYHWLGRKIILAWEKSFYFDEISNYQQRGMQKNHVISTGHALNISCTHAEGLEKINKLFTGSYDKTVKIWKRKTKSRLFKCIQTLQKHQGMITMIASNSKFLFCASTDRTVSVWKVSNETNKYSLHQELLGHEGSITAIYTFKDGDFPLLFTASKDKTIKIWKNIEGTFELFQTLLGHTSGVNCIEFMEMPIGQNQLISGDDEGIIRIWREQHNKLWSCTHEIQAHNNPISAVCFHLQRKSFCTAGGKEAKSWDSTKNGKKWNPAEVSQITDAPISSIKLGHYAPNIKRSEVCLLTEKDLHISWLDDSGISFTDKTIEFPNEDML